MKKLSLLFAALLVTVSVSAQDLEAKKSPEERAKIMTENLAKDVDLSEEQKSKIEAINEQYIADLKAIKADESKDEEQKREAVKEVRKNWKNAVEAELTEEQKAKLKELRAEHKGQLKLSPEERAEKKTAYLKAELGLSEEQTEKVRELNLIVAQKIAAIKSNESLTEEQKKQFIAGNKKDFKKALSTILTKEQMKKFEELKKDHQEKENH